MPFDDRLPFHRKNLPEGVGAKLAEARVSVGRSRRDVAEKVGIAPRTLARIERGQQIPQWPTLKRLCDALGQSDFALAPRWSNDADYVPTSPEVAPGVGLRAVRKARGMTMAGLSAASGVSIATLSRYERGLVNSRTLGRRARGHHDRGEAQNIAIRDDLVATALGYDSAEALWTACAGIGGED